MFSSDEQVMDVEAQVARLEAAEEQVARYSIYLLY
jgi:hypothetical protein